MDQPTGDPLVLRRLGIDTYKEYILFIRADCDVVRAEGFKALTRVLVHHHRHSIAATMNVIHSDLLREGEASLSESAFDALHARENDEITITHLEPISSLRHVRAKIYGRKLSREDFQEVVADIALGRYSSVHLAAFIAACVGVHMDLDEITYLTEGMIAAGKHLQWPGSIVVDKHCVGGLPGNRTTPIVVPIIASCGLTIPKTSSRAITSPAGTADVMETMTMVNLSLKQIKQVVETTGGCMAWGGAAHLSPADDILIHVERALSVDSDAQLVASVLSKKIAAGSTHVLIEIPVGPTAKVRSMDAAHDLERALSYVSAALGLKLKILITDGSQPVGRAIGPTLEALDVLAVLRGTSDAPRDLRTRALTIASEILALAGTPAADAARRTEEILASGQALRKFMEICEAQGGFHEPAPAPFYQDVHAHATGAVTGIDNRNLALVAKLAGAPSDKGAGIIFRAPLGTHVRTGDPIFTVYAESRGALQYAIEFLAEQEPVVTVTA